MIALKGYTIKKLSLLIFTLLISTPAFADECRGIWSYSTKFKDVQKPVINGSLYRVIPHKRKVQCAVVTESVKKLFGKGLVFKSAKKISPTVRKEMRQAVGTTLAKGCKVGPIENLLSKSVKPLVGGNFIVRWKC